MEKNIKLLNGTVDVALRLLAVLSTCKIHMSEDRLAIYSYFAIHFSDMQKMKKVSIQISPIDIVDIQKVGRLYHLL